MNKLFASIFIVSIIINLNGCDNMISEKRMINNDFCLTTQNGGVALIKIVDEFNDELVVLKNFIAYDVLDGILVLCEEIDKDNQSFWLFDLKTEELSEFNTIVDLCENIGIESFDWKPLWVRKFSLKSE